VARNDGGADDADVLGVHALDDDLDAAITCSAEAPRRMSLVPSKKITCETPGWESTSRSSRSTPGGEFDRGL